MEKAFVPLKRSVKTDVRVLEPTQLEASFQYRLVVKGQDQRVAYPESYTVDSYFLFPLQMKINPSTYPLESFYRDVKSYLNFRIPKLTFKEIMGYVEDSDRSPLLKIREHVLQREDSLENRRFIISEARIFASSYFTFITRKSRKITDSLERFVGGESAALRTRKLVEDSFDKVNVIFQEWQKVLHEIEIAVPEIKGELREVDEYIVHNLHDFLLRTQRSFDDKGGAEAREWRSLVRGRLRALRIYSRQCSYAWVNDRSSEVQLESYLHRRGFLKRQVWSALYLDTRTKSLFKIQRQAGAMVAAGIAGLWAAIANIFLVFLGFSGSLNSSTTWGFSTFILVSALTIAYILKDRIKELGRGYFKGSVFRDLPDTSSRIVYKAADASHPLEIGFHEEKADFIESERLPPRVLELIRRMAPERFNAEATTIIHYRKRLGLHGQRVEAMKRKIRALYTFFRLNVSSYLAPLDLAYEDLPVSTARLHTTLRQVPKVYYLDLVLHVQSQILDEVRSEFEYFRLILDKRGIKRIENMALPEGFSAPKGDVEDEDEKDDGPAPTADADEAIVLAQ